MKWALEKIFSGAYLSADEAEKVMDQILQEDLPAEQVAAFLGALQARQENETEVLGFVQSLRKKSEVFSTAGVKALDVCGTGGDASGSFNISTAVALLLAASDIPVVKHGNRAVSSRSGSADVLQALNLPWDLSKPQAEKCFAETGFVFLLAPLYHPVLSKVRTLRQNIGVKTIFNLLGPLLNPAQVQHQLIGVYGRPRMNVVAKTLQNLKTQRALVVHAENGLDEFSLAGTTWVSEVSHSQVGAKNLHLEYSLTAEDFGLSSLSHEDFFKSVRGGDAKMNAKIIEDIFSGQKGAPRDVVVMNAAAALVIFGADRDWASSKEKIEKTLQQNKVTLLLQKLRQFEAQGK